MSETHPAFRRVGQKYQWTAPLAGLREVLDKESEIAEPRWVWRILPHGALVAMQRIDGVRLLRIARHDAPARGKIERWRGEVSTFARHLRLDGWPQADEVAVVGIGVVFTCDERLLCGCGRAKSPNAALFGDGEQCDHCALSAKTGRTDAA